MHKKILLFVVGLLIAVGAFLIYQWLTGWKIAGGTRPTLVLTTQDSKRVTYEGWRPDGRSLEYELKAEGFAQARDADNKPIPGQYVLEQPRATYYTTDNRIIYLRADSGTLRADQVGTGTGLGGRAPKLSPRGGKLAGNVVMAIGPKDSFGDWSLSTLGAGQIQIRFEKELEFGYLDRILQSPGGVQVRGERIAFDGQGLTLAFNNDQRRVEYLRIDKGDKIIIKQALAADSQGGLRPAANNNTQAPVTVNNTAVATQPQIPVANATTKPADAVTYKLQFGREVKATVGNRALSSENLFLLFMIPTPGGDNNKPADTAPAEAVRPAEVVVTSKPANTTQNGSRAADLFAVRPQDNAAAEDLIVTWSGSMEMRPAEPTDLKLADHRDVALEAVGVANNPVIVREGERSARAGRVWYHVSVDRFVLEPATYGKVEYEDSEIGRITCAGANFVRNSMQLQLLGPARAELVGKGLRPGGNRDRKDPLIATWSKSLDLQLATIDDVKNPGKKIQSVKHAVMSGQVGIADSSFAITSSGIEFWVAHTGDSKTPQALEKLVATGPVTVLSARSGSTISDADKPDGLSGQSLELLTTLDGKVPVPSRLNLSGDVIAWSFSTRKTDDGKGQLAKQLIRTSKMEVDLAPKEKPEAGAAQGLGAVAVKEMRAADGVKIEIDGFGTQQVIATAQTLTADPRNGTATLAGVTQANGIVRFARLQQGENQIAGAKILLDQKKERAEIPGNGDFIFVQPGQKPGDQPNPVQVTWNRGMVYDGSALRADFDGSVKARLLGREDQESELRADQLQVQLEESADAKEKGKIRLKYITATKDVVATGGTFDENRKPITRVLLKTGKLTYTEATRTLDIPAAGTMLVEDYRDVPAGAADNQARGQTAFSWAESLTYAGETSTITFKKNVRMIHVPTKPLRVANAVPATQRAENADFAKINRIELNTQRVVATLVQSRDQGGGQTVANPMALGSGGNQKLAKVVADGGAALSVDNTDLAGASIEYDALVQTASALGSKDAPATINGEVVRGVVTADKIMYNIGKREANFEGIRGTVNSPE